jgi:transposase InsO family protein
MTSRTVADLLVSLGVTRSFSRPRTSNDNAAVESSFKTMKYQPTFPVRFASMLAARAMPRSHRARTPRALRRGYQ